MALEFPEVLRKYFPAGSLKKVTEYIETSNVQLRITRSRKYKLGDYRPPCQKIPMHRISINGNLNPYSTLLVFLHELGHLNIWNKYQRKVKPHGKQWKDNYGKLIMEFIDKDVFPENIKVALQNSINNPKASFSSDPELYRTLAIYDETSSKSVLLEEIPTETKFIASNGKTFIKQNKRRKRYRCLCIDNQRYYLIHPLAKIKPLDCQIEKNNYI